MPPDGPSDSSTADPVEKALARFYEAWYVGERLDPDAFCRDHPECGPRLREEIEDFLFISAGLSDAGVSIAPETDPTASTVAGPAGQVIGDFKVVQEIGRGGMGVVYEAEQISLRRRVALKILPAHLSFSMEAVLKFRREAADGARPQHPGIVGVHAIGEREGINFIAQELVEGGRTLADHLNETRRRGEPPRGYFRETADLCANLAEALHHAHQAGVIHRDVKPSNILLTGSGEPKITDFGLAKIEDALALSRSGDFAGTPYYMSPEQAGRSRGGIDHRTDIFSLGITLYEMLTLFRPFEGETSLEVMKKILNQEPRDPHRVNPRVPRDLSVICLKAMEKNPIARYATMANLAQDLHRYLAGEVIVARPAALATRAFKWCRRHRAVSIPVGTLVGLLLVVVVTGLVRQAQRIARFVTLMADAETAAAERRWDSAVERAAEAMRCYPDDALALERHAAYVQNKELEAVTRERDEKEKALRRSEGLRLAASSANELGRNPGLALLLALESHARHPGLISRNALSNALVHCRERRTLFLRRSPFVPEVLGIGRGRLVNARFSPDGQAAITAAWGNAPTIWNLESGTNVPLPLGNSPVRSAEFSPNGRRVVAVGNCLARVWDVDTGRPLCSFGQHGRGASKAVFAPDSHRVFLCSRSTVGQIWDAETGRALTSLHGHQGLILHAAFDAEGTRLATASRDRTVRIWDASRGAELVAVRDVNADRLAGLGFSRDSRDVVVVDRQSGTHRWPVDVVEAAVRLRPRTLTISEKRAFSVWAPAEEAALARVEALFEELVTARDVIARLEADASLSPASRRAAIDLARRQQDDPRLMASIAVRATAPRRKNREAYLRCLRLAEAAGRLDPEYGPRLEYAIAVCCVRTGAARRALPLLERELARSRKTRGRARPDALAYLAMAFLQIGDRAKAERALQEAKGLNEGEDRESVRTWCETLCREVEGILESRS